MRAVAALPASAVVCGSALALSLPDVPLAVWGFTLGAALGVAGAAWHTANPVFLTAALTASFGGGGCLLAADAWQRAWRPPLREAFDAIVAHDRRQTEGEPRRSSRSASEEPDASVFLIGALREDAAPGPNGVSLSVAAQSVRHPAFPNGLTARGGVLISVGGTLIGADAFDAWRAGRTVALPVQLRRAARYLNEGAEDAERSLARRGTTLVGSAKSAVLVEITAAGSWPAEASAAARRFVRRRLANHVAPWSPRSAAIVGAIIIGDRSGLDDEVTRRLQEAGTYHVIAISGGNIAILVALALLGFRVTGMLGQAAMLTAAASLATYAYIVGGGRSVERATLTAVIFLFGRAIDQRGAPANVVAASVGILVAADPLALTDPGFLLTFGATIGILAIAGTPVTREEARLVAAARSMLRASIGAEAMLLPIGAVIFSRVTFAGLALNFAAVPLMAIAQVAGMALVPVSMFWPAAATALGWLAHVSAEGLVRSSALLDWAPWLAWRVAPPSLWVVASYYTALVTAWAFWRRGPAQAGQSVGSSRVDLQACKLEYSIVSPK